MGMNAELARVLERVAALARRERSLLVAASLVRVLALAALALVAAAVVAWANVPRATAASWLTLGGGLGSWFIVGRPLFRAWAAAGDPLRQARLVEAREPALRGRLVTAVTHAEGVRGAESPALLGLVARRAWDLSAAHEPELVHPSKGVRRWGAGAGVVWAVALLAVLLGPGGGGGVWRFWFGGSGALAAVETGETAITGTPARVGDLVLRYVYPDYTGLEPVEVVNSTGEAHAVPGTRVEVVARTASPIDGASLVAYDQAATDATVADGRRISGSFLITVDKGFWKILTHAEGNTEESKHFPIVPEPDLAPEVTAHVSGESGAVIEWPSDKPLPVELSASDDYGLARVVFEVDGREVTPSIRSPQERTRDVADVVQRTPASLGMREGATVQLVVAAWDNDTISGSKVGRSAPLKILVLGRDGVARLDEARRRELLAAMVNALGDFLEETFPPGRSASAYASWGEAVNARYLPLSAFLGSWTSRSSPTRELVPVIAALEDGRTLVRYTQVSFVAESDAAANAESVAAVAAFRASAISGLEIAILHLDALITSAALKELAEKADMLDDASKALSAAAARADVPMGDLLLQLESLSEFLTGVDKALEGVRDETMQDLVSDRTGEIHRLVDEVKASLQANDRPLARTLAARTADRGTQLAQAIHDEIDRRKARAKSGKGGAESAIEMLRKVAEAETKLAQALRIERNKGDTGWRSAVDGLWRRAQDTADSLVVHLTDYRKDMDTTGRRFNEIALADDALSQASALRDAIRARDYQGAAGTSMSTQMSWGGYLDRVTVFSSRTPLTPSARTDAEAITRETVAIGDLLEQLRRRDAQGDPALGVAARSHETEQREIGVQMAAAAAKARQAAQEMTVTPRDLEPALDGAVSRMGSAAEQLHAGDAMQGEGSAEAAARHVRDAIKALEDANSASQQQSDEMSSGGGGGDKQSDKPSGGGDPNEQGDPQHRRFELPEPEEFRTPEQYRDELLRGMEADVPEEYRVLKRRYYDELVHQ